MSPTRKKSAQGASRTLIIEFSGICTLVWNQKAGSAAVHLVDLGSAGFQRHYAALGLLVTEDMTRGIKGPDADAAVSLPGVDEDMGLWNLLGTDVEMVGGTGKLTVDDTKVDVTKKPAPDASSINWLPSISFLAESGKVDPVCPTASVVRLSAGHVTASAAGNARLVRFTANGEPVGPERYCLPRFTATVPFEEELALRLDRQRVLRFTDSASIMISNTCVCGLGVAIPANHFYAHYDVVRAKRRPTVQPAGKLPKTPVWPELCFGGFVQAG